MSTETNERDDFEAWVRTTPGGTDHALRRRDMAGSERLGQHVEPAVEFAWQSWQARAALSTPPAAAFILACDSYAARYRADPADPSQAVQVGIYTDGWDDATAAQPVTPCHQSDATPCAGSNCGTTTAQHSRECIAEHAAAVAGGRFVKVPDGQAPAGTSLSAEKWLHEIHKAVMYSSHQRLGVWDQPLANMITTAARQFSVTTEQGGASPKEIPHDE